MLHLRCSSESVPLYLSLRQGQHGEEQLLLQGWLKVCGSLEKHSIVCLL